MRSRRVLATVPAILATLPLALTALATEPGRLNGPVTDPGGRLAGSGDAVTAAIDGLASGSAVALRVAFLPATDGPSGASVHAGRVATLDALGDHDALCVVGFDDRSCAVRAGAGTGVTSVEEASILEELARPALRAGSVTAVARGLAHAAATDGTAVPASAAHHGSGSSSGSGSSCGGGFGGGSSAGGGR